MSMNLGSRSHKFIAFTPSSLYPESPAGHGSETAHSKEDSRFDLRALLHSSAECCSVKTPGPKKHG